jgi:hypothetical protein
MAQIQKMPLVAYLDAHELLLWNAGSFVGILFTGGLITTGISCIFFLSTNQTDGREREYLWLRAHVVLLLLLVPVFQILVILSSQGTVIFYFHSIERQLQLLIDFQRTYLTLSIVIASVTDAMLVRKFVHDEMTTAERLSIHP